MPKKSVSAVPSKPVQDLALSELHLNIDNPRFGGTQAKGTSEADILDRIVSDFGVDDLLSSIAINGFFKSEPLVGVRRGKGVTIVEGNRRLVACLILAGDPRAARQAKRRDAYRNVPKRPLDLVPVIVFDQSEKSDYIPFIGVRHISGSQPWDSFAKAAWIASVVRDNDLSLAEVRDMIGDEHGTVFRMLEGFYVVDQLIQTGRFSPTESLKKGRGSNPSYPFSWIYTALGYTPVRNWLNLADKGDPTANPIPKKSLDNAQQLLEFLFGNRSNSRPPAITDSRQIRELAISVGEPERLHLLRRGKTIEEVVESTRPEKERVSESLNDASDSLGTAWKLIGEGTIKPKDAKPLVSISGKVKTLAGQVNDRIVRIAGDPD